MIDPTNPDLSPSADKRVRGTPRIRLGIPFALFGIVAIAVGFNALLDEQRLGREGATVSGIAVEKVYQLGDDESSTTYRIRYEYVDPATGQRHGGTALMDVSAFRVIQIGAPVQVTYLPADPATSILGAPQPQLLLPFGVFGVGLLFAVTGSLLIATSRRARQPTQAPASAGVAARVGHVLDESGPIEATAGRRRTASSMESASLGTVSSVASPVGCRRRPAKPRTAKSPTNAEIAANASGMSAEPSSTLPKATAPRASRAKATGSRTKTKSATASVTRPKTGSGVADSPEKTKHSAPDAVKRRPRKPRSAAGANSEGVVRADPEVDVAKSREISRP